MMTGTGIMGHLTSIPSQGGLVEKCPQQGWASRQVSSLRAAPDVIEIFISLPFPFYIPSIPIYPTED